jgi:hypothetical protein
VKTTHTFFSSQDIVILPKKVFSDFAQGLLKSHFEQNLILGMHQKSEKKKK